MALVKYNNRSILNVTALDSIPSGGMNLITTNTITSGVSSSSFTSGIDSTYDTYLFKFINLHPASTQKLQVNFRDGGSDFDATKTTTHFGAYHRENGASSGLAYEDGRDLAEGTGYASISDDNNTDNDHAVNGEMYLFSPASTTFTKHFIARTRVEATFTTDGFVAGYANVTAAIDGVDFKFASGNIDSGVIKMYGLSKS